MDVDKYFILKYNFWDEWFCVVLDGDFFDVLKDGLVLVVMDYIECFIEIGI